MAAQMDNGVNKERVLNDLLKIAKKSGMITAKDLDSAVKMLELDKEQKILEDLERQYKNALRDIDDKIKLLQNILIIKMIQTAKLTIRLPPC